MHRHRVPSLCTSNSFKYCRYHQFKRLVLLARSLCMSKKYQNLSCMLSSSFLLLRCLKPRQANRPQPYLALHRSFELVFATNALLQTFSRTACWPTSLVSSVYLTNCKNQAHTIKKAEKLIEWMHDFFQP